MPEHARQTRIRPSLRSERGHRRQAVFERLRQVGVRIGLFFRLSLAVAVAPLPHFLKIFAFRRCFGFEVDSSATVGLSLVLPHKLTMGPGSRIGHLTVIKGVSTVALGPKASIGNLNWITGFPFGTGAGAFADQPSREPRLSLEEHAAITNRHLLDCTHSVDIGRYATVAGFRTQILTHSISITESRQRSKPVRIGEYTFVGTASIILPGARLPAHSVLGAGSVLNKHYAEEYWLYAGNPAVPVRQLSEDSAYFGREIGFVV